LWPEREAELAMEKRFLLKKEEGVVRRAAARAGGPWRHFVEQVASLVTRAAAGGRCNSVKE
jgi:hypothetical protein